MSTETYNLRVRKALNGWTVETMNGDEIIVVADGEDLGEKISAAIMAKRLTKEPAETESRRVYEAMQSAYISPIGGTQGTITISSSNTASSKTGLLRSILPWK